MGAFRVFVILMLLALNFVGAVFLETKMANFFSLELIIIIIGFVITLIAIAGLAFETSWAWPLTTILFAAALANTLFLYFNIHAILTFAGMTLFNTMGLLISIVSIKEPEDFTSDSAPLETYYPPEDAVKVETKKKPAKKRKKKK